MFAIGKITKKKVPEEVRKNGISASSITEDRTYKIDDAIFENVNNSLDNLGINKNSIGLTDELLEKFYKAEVITSFPDLRLRSQRNTERPWDGRQLQGCIQIKRRYEEKDEDSGEVVEKLSLMEYMKFQDFQDILAKFGYSLEDSDGNKSNVTQVYKAENEVQKYYKELLRDFFTLDEENNLIIATLSSTKIEKKYNAYNQEEMPRDEEDEDSAPKSYDSSYTFNIGIEKIPYQEAVEQYSMRMELLVSLLMISQNSGFCEAVADLAKDFEIVYEIRDNVTTKITTQKYDYISHFYVKKEAKFEYDEIKTQNVNNNSQTNNTNGTTNRGSYDRINNQPVVTNRRVVLQPTDNNPVLLLDDEGTEYRPIPTPRPNTGNENQNDNEQEENQNENTPSNEPEQSVERKSITKSKSGIWVKGRNKDNPYLTTKTTYINNKVTSSITEVKNWIINAKIQYEKQKSNNESNDLVGLAYEEPDKAGWTIPEPEDINLEEYEEVEDYHSLLDGLSYDNVPEGAEKKEETTQVKELRIEGEETTFINIIEEEIKYVKTNSQIEHHEERFLSLLRVDPNNNNTFNMNNNSANTKLIKYENIDGRTFSPEDNILSATQALFDYLASTGYEEIMRYLMYIYTGDDYGIIEFDFYAAYEPQEFRNVQNKMYGGTIQEKVWFALKDLGFSDIAVAGAMGNIEYESNGFTLTAVEGGNGDGIGLIQWSKSRRTQLEAYAISKGVTWQDEETQIEFLIAEISGQGPATEYASLRVSGYITEEGPENKKTRSDWANATNIEEATGAFMRFFEGPLKNSSESLRCQYAQKYYEDFKNLVRGGGEFSFNYGNIQEKYVIGTFTSSITGRTFVAVNQGRIEGWGDSCNRAAQMSVCSGYYDGTTQQLLDSIKLAPDATRSSNGCPTYRNLYDECGLRYRYVLTDEMKNEDSVSAETIRNQIQNGGYIIMYLKGSEEYHTGISKYGRKWAGTMHWVAILGYRIEDGNEQIAVTDSGHNNTGWHPIDEFDGMVNRLLLVDEN